MRVSALVSVVAASDSAHRGLYARVLSFDEHTVSGTNWSEMCQEEYQT